MFEGMEPVFEKIRQLCKANILAIDKIAKENNINQDLIARLFVATMGRVFNKGEGEE